MTFARSWPLRYQVTLEVTFEVCCEAGEEEEDEGEGEQSICVTFEAPLLPRNTVLELTLDTEKE